MVELKSCPFCGGKAELHRPSMAVYTICSKCGISTPYIYPPEEVARCWNNRSAEDTLQGCIAKLGNLCEIKEKRILELEIALSRMMDEKEIACQEAVEARLECLRLEKKLKEGAEE